MSVRETLNGKTCDKCKDLGVTCRKPGILMGGPTQIFIDGIFALRSEEGIDNCPVLTGRSSSVDCVTNLRKLEKGLSPDTGNYRIGNN